MPGGRDAVALPGGEVGATTRSRRRTPRGPPRPRPPRGCAASPSRCTAGRPAAERHPGRGRRDGRVVVVDRQQHRLEQHRLGERRLDDQQRRVGEVDLALGVAPDVAAEPVVGQPRQGRLVDDVRRSAASRAPSSSNRKASIASRARPTPATTPYRRPSGSRRGNSSKTDAPVGGARPRARPGAWSARSGRSAAPRSRSHGASLCHHGHCVRCQPGRGRADPDTRRDHPASPSRG